MVRNDRLESVRWPAEAGHYEHFLQVDNMATSMHGLPMTDQRSRITTAFCVLNVLFGTMLLMAAAFNVTFAVLGIGNLGDYMPLKVGISLAGTVLGLWSGVWLLKRKKHADLLAIAFAVCLLSFEGLLLYEGTFPPVEGSVVVLYGVVSAGYFLAARFRPREKR